MDPLLRPLLRRRLHGRLLACLGLATLAFYSDASEEQKTSRPPSPVPPVLSLAEAKRLAFENNWDLLAARSQVDFATALRIVSREFPNPTFNWSTAKISVDNHSSITAQGSGFWERSYDTLFAINQLFEIGGKRSI